MVEWSMMVLKESIYGSLGIIKSLVIIIIPLMILMQIMTDYKWLEKLSEKTKWITNFLGVSKDTLIPLLIGIMAGISYGAGAIIFAKEKYSLAKEDTFLAMCFLALIHGVIETSLIFWLIGVNPAVAISCRLIVALAGTLLFKWRVNKRRTQAVAAA